jgi:hypothetical protein
MFQSSMKISCGTNNFLFNFTFSFLGFFFWGRVGYNGIGREGDLLFQCGFLVYVVGIGYMLFCFGVLMLWIRNCAFGK